MRISVGERQLVVLRWHRLAGDEPHMIRFFRLLMLCLATAATQPLAAEGLPKAMTCRFDTGTTVNYTQGIYEPVAASPLTFDVAEVDLDAQAALLMTASGKGLLRIVRAVNANHFLEVVNEGFLNITTIYDLDARRQAYPAVHSRHFGLLGEPVVAQYYGFCSPK
jgi:hypothetical protein